MARISEMVDGQAGSCMSGCMLKGTAPILSCTAVGRWCMVSYGALGDVWLVMSLPFACRHPCGGVIVKYIILSQNHTIKAPKQGAPKPHSSVRRQLLSNC